MAMTHFYRTTRRHGRWFFVDPSGEPFWSLGMNHLDSATLRYPDSGDAWEQRHGNSMEIWLRHVREDLLDWGFNTVGWVQEVVTRSPENHRHSRAFTPEEYQWLDMPYCHLLPFAEIHQWEVETRLPDITSTGFEEWCDYVARDHCARLSDDPKLIGYFSADCPVWVHTTHDNEWRGSLFDAGRLESDAGRRELSKLAERYYRVTHDAVRRYDANHLILGDRYEANAPLPIEVTDAATPFVDVMSFQCFGTPDHVRDTISRFAGRCRRPVLVADSAQRTSNPHGASDGVTDPRHDPAAHGRVLDMLIDIPECIGYHLCGAYLKNRTRRSGFRDHRDVPDQEMIAGMRDHNRRAIARIV